MDTITDIKVVPVPHTLSPQDALAVYKSGRGGLTTGEAKYRLQTQGKNELTRARQKGKLSRFFRQFANFMIIILLVAAAVSTVIAIIEESFNDLIDVGIILAIVILNAVIGYIQESKAEDALSKLKKMSTPYARVMREGMVHEVLTTNVVVGDIVLLEAGDIACADILLLESASLRCDESSLTGESTEVQKEADKTLAASTGIGDRINMVHSSSVVTYGRGRGVVVAIGMNTELGKIAGMLSERDTSTTPIQQKLNKIGKWLTWVILGIAALIFILNVVIKADHNITQSLMIAIAISVAAIPESLPAVVTIIMAMGVLRMSKKKAIIRKLHAVETLGSCQIICSDKTGTLTQNKMKVTGIWVNRDTYLGSDLKKLEDQVHFLNCLQLCNDCIVEKDKIRGDPTETALVEFALSLGFNKHFIEGKYPRVAELPFDSNRKMMTTFHRVGNKILGYTKGAPDVILPRCTHILIDGKPERLTPKFQDEIKAAIDEMAAKGWRLLAASFKENTDNTYKLEDEQDMIFLGIVGMRDPPRESTAKAVQTCINAKMLPIMITGDHAVTAKEIAREIGIWQPGSRVLTGAELDNLTDAAYLKIIREVSVYARVSPANKVRIVEMWQKLGKVVAMTGDGVNDAPSVKKADIGIGMGKDGTEVTKEVADMVLADDNFATIIIAIKEGRKIYQNIRKTIHFLFGTNFVEVASLLLATLIFPQLIFLLPLQILFINLITDSLPAIALSVEEAEPDIMDKPPRDKKEGIFAGGMWQSMLVQTIFQTAVVVLLFAAVISITGSNMLATTMAFVTLAAGQLFHVLNIRTTHSIFQSNPFKNKWIWLSILVGLALLALVVCVPGIAAVFGFISMSFAQWMICLGLAALIVPVMELYKLLVKIIKAPKIRRNKK